MLVEAVANSASSLTSEEAYQLGYDYVAKGANQINCHFHIFCDSAHAAAWEEGRLSAERESRPVFDSV